MKTLHCSHRISIFMDCLLLSVSGTSDSGTSDSDSGTSGSSASASSAWAVASVIEAMMLAIRVAVVVVVVVEAMVVMMVVTVVTTMLVVVVVVDVAAVVVVAAVVALAAWATASAATGSVTFVTDLGAAGDSNGGGVTVVFGGIVWDGHGAGESHEGEKPDYEKLGHG